MIRLEPKPKSRGLKRSPLKRKPLIRKPPKVYVRKPLVMRERKPLKPMSKKMQVQRRQEDKLSLKLAELSGNCCEICGKHLPIFGLHKHEIITRGRLGSETDAMNCLMLCLTCHDHRKYPKSGTPLSIDEQLVLAKILHENIT
jgi:hypothetical protein